MYRVPSRGVDPSVRYLDDANATHSRTQALASRVWNVRVIVIRKVSSNRIPNAFVSLQILIAFAPNPIYTFSAASAIRGVCRFLSKQARRARFKFIEHIRDIATKIARNVIASSVRTLSILPVRRTGHGSRFH